MAPLPETQPINQKSTPALIDEIWSQFQQTTRDLERVLHEERQSRQRAEQLQAQLERLQQLYTELQQRQRETEKSAREGRMQADALKIRLAYAEDIIANLNQSLTWCQNKAWEIMTVLRDLMGQPHHRVGRSWQVLTRDRKATLKALASWAAHRMLLRPYSLSKALPAPYPEAEQRESLEILAFYARDAQRQISDLPVTTPTSMAAATLHGARRARPDLIVYSITNWAFRQQRPQHLVGRLVARGSRAFVMPTDLPGLGTPYPSDEQILARMTIRMIGEDLWEVTPCAFNNLNIYRDSLRDGRDLAILGRSLALLRERFGIGHHVGLVQLPFWGPLAVALPGARVLYDCMDNHRDFSTNDPAMLEQEDRLLTEADAVVVSSDYLDRAVGGKPRAKALIRNGCEYEVFATAPEVLDPAVAGLEGPVIGYYGAISDWFDTRLVEAVARRRPDWHFVLTGHTFGAAIEGLQALPNVLFTGEVPYARLTSFLYRFDVCMIPFRLTELIQATNPVKIYEYSAAGKPTVATRIPEVERLGDLVAIADDAGQFERAIAAALAEPDPAGRAGRLRAFARENTWDTRAAALETVLREHVYPRVSVVVLSYRNWPLTRDCIQSILDESTYPNFELIVVDNASDGETRAQLSALSDPRLKVHLNETNLGYAGGNNCGARLADGDFIILLNNDTVCPPDWIERLLAPFAEDPRVGMAGPMTNSAGNEQMLDVFCQSNQDQRRWLLEFYRVRRGRRHRSDRLGFFCVAIRRAVWEQVGELDAGFEVGFFEDDDYCARVVEAGWELTIAEDAFVYHHGSASFNKIARPERQAIEEKNRARFEAKHRREWQPPICEYMHYGAGGPGHEERPVAVIAPGVEWNAPPERPQQLALALVRAGWKVYYLTGNERLDHFLGVRMLAPFLYIVERRAQWLEELAAQRIDLLLSFSPDGADFPPPPAARRLVLDLSGPPGRAWTPDDPAFAAAAAQAALITAARPGALAALPEGLRKKTVLVPNGIETGIYRRPAPLVPPGPIARLVQAGGGPLLGVWGTLGGQAAWPWLEELAKLRRNWAVVYLEAGLPRETDELPAFFNLRNVHLVRGQQVGELADYLAWLDAALVPPGDGPAEDDRGRTSALAFLSGGLPVAAAPALDDLNCEGLSGGLTAAAAVEAIERNLARRRDYAFGERCAAFAQAFDWSRCVEPLKNAE